MSPSRLQREVLNKVFLQPKLQRKSSKNLDFNFDVEVEVQVFEASTSKLKLRFFELLGLSEV